MAWGGLVALKRTLRQFHSWGEALGKINREVSKIISNKVNVSRGTTLRHLKQPITYPSTLLSLADEIIESRSVLQVRSSSCPRLWESAWAKQFELLLSKLSLLLLTTMSRMGAVSAEPVPEPTGDSLNFHLILINGI